MSPRRSGAGARARRTATDATTLSCSSRNDTRGASFAAVDRVIGDPAGVASSAPARGDGAGLEQAKVTRAA
jgi:hypothetical protein